MRRFGEFLIKYWIALFIVVLAITAFLFLHLPNLEIESDMKTWFPENDPAFIKFERFLENFPEADFIVVAYESENPFSEAELEYLSNLTEELKHVPYVAEPVSLTTADDVVATQENAVIVKDLVEKTDLSDREIKNIKEKIERNPLLNGSLVSEDYSTVSILLNIDIPKAEEEKRGRGEIERQLTNGIREILDREHKETGRVFHLGGSPITANEVNEGMAEDIGKFLPFAVILMGAVLYFIFRSVLCVIFPLITVLLALVWTLGLKGMLDSPISPISTTLFTLIIAIGMADAIHFISHYFIELPRFTEKKDAILETYKRAGMPCLLTSLTTAIGFGSLVISPLAVIRNLGIFASFGIMSAFVLTMIIIPNALLRMKIRPRLKQHKESKMLGWIGRFNLKHSKWVLLFGGLIFLVMGAGITGIYVEGSILQYLKGDSILIKDAEFLDETLGGISSADVVLYGHRDSFKDPEVLKRIDRFQELVEQHPKVSASYSMVDHLKLMDRALYNDSQKYFKVPDTYRAVDQILLSYELSDSTEMNNYTNSDYDMARISIRTYQMDREERDKLIQEIEESAGQNFGEFKVDITGIDAMIDESTAYIVATQLRSLGLALAVIFGIMILVFGIKGGLVSIFPNIFPLVFLLGLMGYANFTLNIATATIAAIAIGLVVDDTIHYFSHFKHEYQISGDVEFAVNNALQKVGRALCFTTLTLALGCLIFLFSQTSILIDFAILTSLAIVVALLGDLFFGPVLLARLKVFAVR